MNLKDISLQLVIFGSVLVFSGCSTQNKVDYTFIEPGMIDYLSDIPEYSIAFRSSIINVKLGENNDKLPLVTISNIEHKSFMIGLTPNRNLWRDSIVNMSKLSNTDLPDEIGVEVIDRRVGFIEGIGAIIQSGIGFLAMDDDSRYFGKHPISELIEHEDTDPSYSESHRFSGPPAIEDTRRTDYILGPLPANARRVSADIINGLHNSNIYIYAACRPLNMLLPLPDGRKISYDFKISDPRFFQAIKIPQKGKIVHHNECGVSVTTETNVAVDTFGSIAEAFKNQAEAINKALEERKNGNQ